MKTRITETTAYQAIALRENQTIDSEEIANGITTIVKDTKYRSDVPWLIDGSYFWEHEKNVAHNWGKRKAQSQKLKSYCILEAKLDIHESVCLDLAGNMKHKNQFKKAAGIVENILGNGNISVRRILLHMQQEGFLDSYGSVRILATNLNKKPSCFFELDDDFALDLSQAPIICVTDKEKAIFEKVSIIQNAV